MARITIESQAAPAAQGPIETKFEDAAILLLIASAVLALANPGLIAGGAVVLLWRWLQRPSLWLRLIFAIVLVIPLALLHDFVIWAWPWHQWLSQVIPEQISSVDGNLALRSMYTEALAGPLWFEGMLLANVVLRRRVDAQIRRDHRLDQRRYRAITGERQSLLPDPQTTSSDQSLAHPLGQIRLGLDAETRRPFDLELPVDLATHVFLPGAPGTGKTTTVTRLGDGVLASGCGLVIVDCKGGGLAGAARRLAARYQLPFHLVDPDDPDSLGYNPCSGDAASVANKLVGAFTYGANAEIYKNIAMEAVPVVVRGLEAAGEPVTLEALHDAFNTRGLEKIAQKIKSDERIRQRLLDLAPQGGDRAGSGGHAGLRYRLGALLEGKFGDLFRQQPTLDWEQALATPSVTYIALSALASSEDVELMGRVVAQDLKQVCARRLRAIGDGADIAPVLAVFDEFAALQEAEQLVDLLLQARQALMPVVISTQYLPETTSLRRACLGAGLIIAHRVEAEDAEAIAAQFGTRRASEVTHQVDYKTGFSEKGTQKRVEKFNMHPNELRTFKVGQAALLSVPKGRYTILQIYNDST
ncbi:MAG: hypothetical protein ACRDMH_07025 [Solirubrobacterales bacterium]